MLRRTRVGPAVATLAALLGFTAARPALPAAAGPAVSAAAPVRIMPLGDSITGAPGCWRALLWKRLRDSGHDVDFVGTLHPPGCGQPYDGDNEGHAAYLATTVADQRQLPGWLAATRPDIVLMHLGTNDVWRDVPPAAVLAAYGRLVDQMRAGNPDMKIMVAQLIPMAPGNCGDCGRRAVALNRAIPSWAAGKSTRRSPITVVDQWTGFDTGTDTTDGVHPNAAGDRKIADRWYPALAAALGRVPSPAGSPSSTPAPSAPASRRR